MTDTTGRARAHHCPTSAGEVVCPVSGRGGAQARRRPRHRSQLGQSSGGPGTGRAQRAARRAGPARLEAVPRAVQVVHADHPGGRGVASMAIGEIATGIAVLLITALNALGGMRQQGKAESAMNALQSMLKTTARVRRDGIEVKVDADQVVVGDTVLLAAGDDVCADGRLVETTSLQIDESALTGESVPASKERRRHHRPRPGPGRPVEHGVHEHSGDSRRRRHDRHGDRRRHRRGSDLRHAEVGTQSQDAADQAARHADLVDRRCRGADHRDHVRPRALPRRLRPDDLHDGHRARAGCRAHGHAHGAAGHLVQRVHATSRRTGPW